MADFRKVQVEAIEANDVPSSPPAGSRELCGTSTSTSTSTSANAGADTSADASTSASTSVSTIANTHETRAITRYAETVAPAPATAQPWQRADQTWRAQEPALGVFRHPKAFMFSPSAGRIAGESDEETSDGDEFPVLVLGKQARAMAPDPLHILGVHQPKPKPPRVIADRRYRIAFQAGHGSFPRPGYLERNLGTDATKEYAVRRSRSQLRTCCGLGYVLFLPFAFVLLVVNALARCHWRYWCGCEHPCCERCDRLCCAHARESARLRAGVGATGGEEGGGHQRARHDHRARDMTLEDLEYAQEADVS